MVQQGEEMSYFWNSSSSRVTHRIFSTSARNGIFICIKVGQVIVHLESCTTQLKIIILLIFYLKYARFFISFIISKYSHIVTKI